jgi:uncharacterized protein YukE
VAQSFAGITVPEGEPGELRSAAKALTGLSDDLASTAHELDGQPSTLGGWVGQASVAYAGTCMQTSAALNGGSSVVQAASAALSRYGEGLQHAQHEARHAITQAREAQHRIDRAKRAIAEASARAADARARDSVAHSKIALTSIAGVPPPGAVAEQARARSDAAAAELDEYRAQRELEEAQADLARAKAAGARAEEHARELARGVAAAFEAAAVGGLTAPGASGGAPEGVAVGGWVGLVGDLGKHLPAAGIELMLGLMEVGATKRAEKLRHFFKGGGKVPGLYRFINGEDVRVPRYVGDTSSAAYQRAIRNAGMLEKVGKGVKFAGGVLSALTGGAEQYGEDAGRKDLSTTDKVGRTGMVSAYKGAATYGGGAAGAEIGAAYGAAWGSAIPVPIVGTISGAAVGAVVGGVIGSGAAAYVADKTKSLALHAGELGANAAVHGVHAAVKGARAAAKGAEDVAKGAGKVLDSISPF